MVNVPNSSDEDEENEEDDVEFIETQQLIVRFRREVELVLSRLNLAETEITRLEAENEHLETENQRLQADIERAENAMARRNQPREDVRHDDAPTVVVTRPLSPDRVAASSSARGPNTRARDVQPVDDTANFLAASHEVPLTPPRHPDGIQFAENPEIIVEAHHVEPDEPETSNNEAEDSSEDDHVESDEPETSNSEAEGSAEDGDAVPQEVDDGNYSEETTTGNETKRLGKYTTGEDAAIRKVLRQNNYRMQDVKPDNSGLFKKFFKAGLNKKRKPVNVVHRILYEMGNLVYGGDDILRNKFLSTKSWTRGNLQRNFVRSRIVGNYTRHYSDYRHNRVYVTTPIFYVNAGPHIGHLYSAAIADTVTRYNAMLGHEVFLSTGTDEHGNKVKNAASASNLSTNTYCDKISDLFREMCRDFDVDYTNFIRTTEPRHCVAVHEFWTTLQKAGHIYLGKYSGWYCVSDEAFLPDSELEVKKNSHGEMIKVSASSGQPVEWMEEDNYKFRLSSFQADLKYWLKNVKSVKPAKYHKILSNWIDDGRCLEDLSISRPASRAPWGIKVPQDDSHTIYVWLDALVNYLTSLGYPNEKFAQFWPPTVQVIGKDILKFHGVYWPAFLIAAGLEPPTTLLCHSHWTVCDEKMSKSKGNVVSPVEAAKIYTPDGLRYFLLREAVPHSDANYSDDKVRKIVNTELADTLGNLVSRCMGKIVNPRAIVPEPSPHHLEILNSDEASRLIECLNSLALNVQVPYGEFNFHAVVDTVMTSLFAANKMVEHHKPWALVKQVVDNEEASLKLEAVLALGLEAARIAALVLLPIIPRLSSSLLDSLNVPLNARIWENCRYSNTGRNNIEMVKKESAIFFKRLR